MITHKISTAKYSLYLMHFMGNPTVTLNLYILLLFCFLLKYVNNTKMSVIIVLSCLTNYIC